MFPLKITTAQFGQQWGSCPHTSSITVTSKKVDTLDKFMTLCESVGSHKIESIAATNEGICGAMVGGTIFVLIHGKVSPLGNESKLDVTIKSTDVNLGNCLAMYLQNLIR